jgi:LuxR family maltose regulon positive regulatory protein
VDRALVPIPESQARPPSITWDVVERRRLFRRLSQAVEGFPLTLVRAPAGAGKTVLAADWVARGTTHAPVAWVTVTQRDEQPGVFWAHLRLALATAEALATESLRPMFPDEADVDSLSQELLRRPAPVVLVIDAVDRIRAQAVFDRLARLLANAGDRLRIVMTTRVDPPLPLHRHRLEGLVAEIHDDELALSRSEVGQVLAQHGLATPDARIDEVLCRTEGWAAGVRLAGLRLRSRGSAAPLDGFASDYLIKEVIEPLDPADRELLAMVSVVDHLPRGLAPALTGRPDADEAIRRLSTMAFVEPVVGRPEVCRVHPLLRELLVAGLHGTVPGRSVALHRRAAEWFAEKGNLEQAVRHATAADDWEYAAALVIEGRGLGEVIARTTTGARLAEHLMTMPEPESDATRLLQAAIAIGYGELDLARSDLDRSGGGPRGRYALARGVVQTALHDAAARPDEALAAARDARSRLISAAASTGTQLVRAALELAEGSSHLRVGDLEMACAALAQALAAAADVDGPLRLRCLAELSLAEAGRGHLTRALRLADAADRAASDQDVPASSRPMAIGLGRAWVALERQDLGQAQRCLDQVGRRRRADAEGLQTVASLLRVRLMRDRGDSTNARKLLQKTNRPTGWLRDHLDAEALALCPSVPDPGPALDASRRNASRAPSSAPRGIPHRVRVLLERADARYRAGGAAAAKADVARALTIAQPERIRRPFAHASPRVRVMVRNDLALSAKAGWLRPEQLGGSADLPARAHEAEPLPQTLSGRELEVLRHLSVLLTTDEIAAEMFISVNTVRTHVRRILEKLSVSRRNEAVRRGRELGLV